MCPRWALRSPFVLSSTVCAHPHSPDAASVSLPASYKSSRSLFISDTDKIYIGISKRYNGGVFMIYMLSSGYRILNTALVNIYDNVCTKTRRTVY